MYKDGRKWLYAAIYKEEDAKLARYKVLVYTCICIWLHSKVVIDYEVKN
jgi:hypothetical protein